MKMKRLPFVDLFCGAGGLSIGFEQAGFKCVYALDNDPNACETFSRNHKGVVVACTDVENITGKQILSATGEKSIPLLIGGPNCQGVSLRGKRDPNDPKNKMFFHFVRILRELNPEWFVMENVPGLMHRHNRNLATDIYEEFEGLGYRCGGEVLCAAEYGVPQLRYRFVLIGNRINQPVLFPNPTHQSISGNNDLFGQKDTRPSWITIREAISDLPAIPNGAGTEECDYPAVQRSLSAFQMLMRKNSKRLLNHVAHKTPQHNIDLIMHIPQGKAWKAIPEELRPSRFKRVALKDHTTTYGRLSWEMPARTITTYFNNITAGQFTHPVQHRGISVREGARIQSFPDKYKFYGPLAKQYRQVGNAVPCLLGNHIAKLVYGVMQGKKVSMSRVHVPSVTYDSLSKALKISRPLQGMRFNLDKHLIRS